MIEKVGENEFMEWWKMGDHIVMLARISQAIPTVCDLELEIEGTQSLAIQKYYSIAAEREGEYTQASLENNIPALGPRAIV